MGSAGTTLGGQAITDFGWVDRSADPAFYRRFLDLGNALPGIRASKPILLGALRVARGARVLDVGCGMGADVVALAECVGPAGRAEGVDSSETLVAEARRRAPVGLPIEFHVADAHSLPFEADAFDGARAERLLMHVADAERVVSEMVRVVRPGGRVAIFDFDWDTFVIDSPDRDVTRAVVRSFCDAMKTGWIGRRLPRIAWTSGLEEVEVTPRSIFVDFDFFGLLLGGHLARMQASGALAAEQLASWWNGLADHHAAGQFFAGFTAFIVSGTKRLTQ